MTDPRSRRSPRTPSAERLCGFSLLLLAAGLFSLMAVSAKVALAGLSPAVVLFVRGVLMTTVSWLWLRARGVSPWGTQRRLLFARGAVGSLSLLCFFVALSSMPLADVTTLYAFSPVSAALCATLVVREPISRALLLTLLLSLLGVGFVTRPFAGDAALLPALVACVGAALAGLAYTLVRALRTTEPPLVIVFAFAGCSTLGALPLLPWAAPRWPTPNESLALLGVAAFTQLAQLALSRGLALVPAGPATAVSHTQIPFAILWGLLFFGEVPSWSAWVGACLIAAGLGVNLWAEASAKATEPSISSEG